MSTVKTLDISTVSTVERLSELLDEAEGGQHFVLTREGDPVARIVPDERRPRSSSQSALERLRDFRGMFGDLTLEELLEDRRRGHRF